MFDVAGKTPPELQNHGNYCNLHYHWDMSSPLPPPPPPTSHKRDSEKIVHRTVVGYLGTIDIPNQLHPSCMMQVICNFGNIIIIINYFLNLCKTIDLHMILLIFIYFSRY